MVSCPAGQVYDEVLVALYAKVQRWRTVWGLVNISDGLYNDTAANVTLVNMSRQVAENLTVWASGQPLFALDAESKYFRLRVLCQCFTGPLPYRFYFSFIAECCHIFIKWEMDVIY